MKLGKQAKIVALKAKILLAEDYLENGDSLKDVMDDSDIVDAVSLLAKMIRDKEI